MAKRFALLGARNFLLETLSAENGVLEAIHALKQTVPEAFVLVSFAVLPDGYTARVVTAPILCAAWRRAAWWMPWV